MSKSVVSHFNTTVGTAKRTKEVIPAPYCGEEPVVCANGPEGVKSVYKPKGGARLCDLPYTGGLDEGRSIKKKKREGG